MILTSAELAPRVDASRFAWAGLRRFQNVHFVEEVITSLHGVTAKHKQNVRKQATQIRYALTQAKEYFDAAATVTLATKPNLLYYSIMSLALAEILLKQTGESSLDKAREQHDHHGLVLQVRDTSNDVDLTTASASLRAQPLIRNNGERFGTFELWHRSCREMPICGTERIYDTSTGSGAMRFRLLLNAADVRLPLLPESGLSLFDCFVSSPGMSNFLIAHAVEPRVLRSRSW
jgi:YaaC-like Protein